MRIARVFPTKTSMSPDDRDVYFGGPELFMPRYDEVHISVAFTWDLERTEWLKKQWESTAPVRVGGPAVNGEGDGFVSGMYLRNGITITSRGCPNRCPWCFIKGPLRELDVKPGNNIIDNNFLACSNPHLDKVFRMLGTQRKIHFSGGLETSRITAKIAERIRGLRIDQLFLAYDDPNRFNDLKKALVILKKHFTRRYLRCYVLVGYYGDTLEKAEIRLRQAWEAGTIPYAMRYRTPKTNWKNTYLFKERAWNLLARKWTRPAIIKTRMKELLK